MRAQRLRQGWPSAGLFIGAVAWFVNQQSLYALVPWICAHPLPLLPALALAFAGVSLVGGALSWRAYSAPHPCAEALRTHRFVAAVGMLAAGLFAAAIVLQGLATLIIDACAR